MEKSQNFVLKKMTRWSAQSHTVAEFEDKYRGDQQENIHGLGSVRLAKMRGGDALVKLHPWSHR